MSGPSQGTVSSPKPVVVVNLAAVAADCRGVQMLPSGSTADALLVVRAQLGDRRSLAELVTRWHEPVRRYVHRMVTDLDIADDVGQQVWARALKALPGLNQPERFAPWLFTIARRSVMDWLAEKYGRGEVHTADDVAIDDHAPAVLDRAQVADGLAGLPAREREVLILFYLQDFSLQECAEVLQVPAGTVKSRLFKARQLLKNQLTEKGYPA
jgi:RNA polymerase sigma factor (sigma-70 family)